MNVLGSKSYEKENLKRSAPCTFPPPTLWLNRLLFVADPNMVSAYMYPAGPPGTQAAPQAQAGPAPSSAYSTYQPSPAAGYQVGVPTSLLPGPCLHLVPTSPLPSQNVASQAPQSLPAISQPPPSGTMGYVGSQSVSLGYQPYSMQVRSPLLSTVLRALLEATSLPGSGFLSLSTESHDHPSWPGCISATAAALHCRAAARVPAGEPCPA